MLHHMLRAAAQRAFSVLDPYFQYVTMLLHGDGTNGAQNNTFLDSSANNFTITRNGNTTQGTFTPYGANWSVNFTGAQTSPSLTYPSISAYDLGATSQWTYECWVYFASLSGEQSIFERWSGTGGPGWLLTKLSTNAYRAHFGSSVYIDTGAIAVAGQWIHLAVSRDGSTGSLFVDGVRQATTSSVANFSDGTDPLVFGERNSGSQTFPFNGYISNARIVKGTYVYNPSSTSITVPTAPLTAITNTVFLGLQSNRYIDNSSNNATATVSSASSIQRFSPFSPTTAYSTSVIGGSGYFDGSGDYLTAAQNAAFNLGTGAFTVEAWVYITASNGTNQRVIGLGDGAIGGGPYTGWTFNINNNLTTINWYRYDGTETDLNASYTFKTNTWYHIVAVRNGSSNLSMFVNGSRVYNNASASLSYNNVNTNPLYVGAITDGAGGGGVKYFNGYMSNARIVAGSAVYDPTSSTLTVPTAPLTAISGTSLLMNYTNAGILDNAMMNDLETVGNAQISTSVKKYGTGSMSFDGTGDGLVVPDNVLADFGSGDFTIEFWIYLNSVSGEQFIYGQTTDSSPNYTSPVRIQMDGAQMRAFFSTSSGTWGTRLQAGASNSTGTWYHFAIVRNGTSVVIYRNGTSYDSGTQSGTLYNSSEPVRIGYTIIGGTSYASVNGYIDDLRITKGYARYTANFTPPTAAFPNN